MEYPVFHSIVRNQLPSENRFDSDSDAAAARHVGVPTAVQLRQIEFEKRRMRKELRKEKRLDFNDFFYEITPFIFINSLYFFYNVAKVYEYLFHTFTSVNGLSAPGHEGGLKNMALRAKK